MCDFSKEDGTTVPKRVGAFHIIYEHCNVQVHLLLQNYNEIMKFTQNHNYLLNILAFCLVILNFLTTEHQISSFIIFFLSSTWLPLVLCSLWQWHHSHPITMPLKESNTGSPIWTTVLYLRWGDCCLTWLLHFIWIKTAGHRQDFKLNNKMILLLSICALILIKTLKFLMYTMFASWFSSWRKLTISIHCDVIYIDGNLFFLNTN